MTKVKVQRSFRCGAGYVCRVSDIASKVTRRMTLLLIKIVNQSAVKKTKYESIKYVNIPFHTNKNNLIYIEQKIVAKGRSWFQIYIAACVKPNLNIYKC